MPEPENHQIRVSPDAICQEVGGEMVILDLASDYYFGLDEIGTLIWQGLSESRSIDDIVDALLAEYDVAEEDLRRDVTSLVSELESAGLVEKVVV